MAWPLSIVAWGFFLRANRPALWRVIGKERRNVIITKQASPLRLWRGLRRLVVVEAIEAIIIKPRRQRIISKIIN